MIIKTIQKEKDITLTCYIQTPSKELPYSNVKPAILILPGGGYEFCSDREAEPIALAYLNKGFNAFVLRYSVKEKAVPPRPLQDAEWAMDEILSNADEYQIDKDKIACIGFSAGGNLAALLATKGTIRPNALIVGYGVMHSDVLYEKYPAIIVDEKTPETFLFHTYKDSLVPVDTSLYMASELSKHNIPFEIHVFRDGEHGLSLGTKELSWGENYQAEPRYQAWHDMSVEWLKVVLDL